MKGFCFSFLVLFCFLFLLISPSDAMSTSRRRRRRVLSLSGGYEKAEEARRNSHPSERKCKPALTNPVHGTVACTDRNNYKSVCEYACDEGYQLSDPESCVIFCEGKKWSRMEPFCKAVKTK